MKIQDTKWWISVPPAALFNIEHEKEDGMKEIEFQVKRVNEG